MREEVQIRFLPRFDRAFARCCHARLLFAEDFAHVLELFMDGEPLPAFYHDHPLTNNLTGYREFHLGPDNDLVVIYRRRAGEVVFADIGGHEELFAHRKRREKGRPSPAPESFLEHRAGEDIPGESF